jgi:hypothetical protein
MASLLLMQALKLKDWFTIFIFYNLMWNYFSVDRWQEKRKKYVESKYFRMLHREGKLNNPNLVPVGTSQKIKVKETK